MEVDRLPPGWTFWANIMNLRLYLPLFSVSSVKTETCLSCSRANFWWNSKLWKMKSEVANRSYADEQSSILRLYVDARNSCILSSLRIKNSLPKQSSLPYQRYLSSAVQFFKMGFWVGFNSNLAPIWRIFDLNIGFWLGFY